MSETALAVARDPRNVATIRLNRPDIRNAFDDALIAELTATVETLGAEAAIRAIVLTGEGKAFSAGADLNWMRRMAGYGREENLADARALAKLMHVLNNCPKPTIARVNGPAMGGGVGLVACCDIAIASETAFFALSEARLGLIPAVISPFVVAAMGPRAARRYFLTGERFDAAAARALGLVHEIAPADGLDARVEAALGALLLCGPAAQAAAKALIAAVANRPVDAAILEDTATRIADIRAGEEGREGVAAFLEKRKPGWIADDG